MIVTTCRGCQGVVDVARAMEAKFQATESDTMSHYFRMLERLVEKAQQPDEVMRKIKGMIEEEPEGVGTTIVHFCPMCAETMMKHGFISNTVFAYPAPESGESS